MVHKSTIYNPNSIVDSLTSSNGSLTVSNPTGVVDVIINTAHANTWSAMQTFNNGLTVQGWTLTNQYDSGGINIVRDDGYNGSGFQLYNSSGTRLMAFQVDGTSQETIQYIIGKVRYYNMSTNQDLFDIDFGGSNLYSSLTASGSMYAPAFLLSQDGSGASGLSWDTLSNNTQLTSTTGGSVSIQGSGETNLASVAMITQGISLYSGGFGAVNISGGSDALNLTSGAAIALNGTIVSSSGDINGNGNITLPGLLTSNSGYQTVMGNPGDGRFQITVHHPNESIDGYPLYLSWFSNGFNFGGQSASTQQSFGFYADDNSSTNMSRFGGTMTMSLNEDGSVNIHDISGQGINLLGNSNAAFAGAVAIASYLTVVGSTTLDNGSIATDGAGNLGVGNNVNASAYKIGGTTVIDGSRDVFSTLTTATNGFMSSGSYSGSFSDGVIVDFASGNARITTGPGDNIQFYNNKSVSTLTYLGGILNGGYFQPATGYKSSDGTNGATTTSSTFKNGLYTGTNVGQATLVSGTKAITISGLTTSNKAFVQLVTPSGTLGAAYKAVCTTNTLTITAVSIAGVTVTTDTSTLNYFVL